MQPNLLHFINGFELSNLTLLAGVLISVGVRRASGVNPGGVLVAAFLVLTAATSPLWALLIPVVAAVIAVSYKRFFSHIFLGRQPLFLMGMMSVVIMTICGLIMSHFGLISVSGLDLPLGIITPAILAATIQKQGLLLTYGFTILAIGLTIEAVAVLYFFGRWLGYDFYAIDHLAQARDSLYEGWNAIQAFVSLLIGYVLYRWRNVKAAGYIMLPFLTLLCLVSPLNLALIAAIAIITYLITWIVRRYSLLVGVGRYAFVIVTAVTLTWTAERLILTHTTGFAPFMGAGVLASLSVAILVNEHTLYGVRRTLPLLALGLALMVGLESAALFGSQKILHHQVSLVEHHHPTDANGHQR